MTIKERMEKGMMYHEFGFGLEKYKDEANRLTFERSKYKEFVYDFNNTRPSQTKERERLLREIFGKVGEGCFVEPPLRVAYGKNVTMGKDCYANFNLVLVDDSKITIGDNVMFAPNVVVSTAGHPVDPTFRQMGTQYSLEIKIGNNVWIGAGAVILPGVTIGDNTVIGAGSIVTRSIPENVVAFGNPCKVVREIGERDKKYYFRDLAFDQEFIDEANNQN